MLHPPLAGGHAKDLVPSNCSNGWTAIQMSQKFQRNIPTNSAVILQSKPTICPHLMHVHNLIWIQYQQLHCKIQIRCHVTVLCIVTWQVAILLLQPSALVSVVFVKSFMSGSHLWAQTKTKYKFETFWIKLLTKSFSWRH